MNKYLPSVLAVLVLALGYWLSGAPWERGENALIAFWIALNAGLFAYIVTFPGSKP